MDVAAVLTRVGAARGLPPVIKCDQGTEFTSLALDHWAHDRKVMLDFSRRARPGDNALCEAFNGSVRRECLSQAYFSTHLEVQTELDRWRADYNNHRPHQSLANLPSAPAGQPPRPSPGPDYAAPDGPKSGPSAPARA